MIVLLLCVHTSAAQPRLQRPGCRLPSGRPTSCCFSTKFRARKYRSRRQHRHSRAHQDSHQDDSDRMHSQRVHATRKLCSYCRCMLQASSSTSRTPRNAAGITAPGLTTSALFWARLPSSQLMMSACAPTSTGAESAVAARMPGCVTSAAQQPAAHPRFTTKRGQHMQTCRTHKGAGPALGAPIDPRQSATARPARKACVQAALPALAQGLQAAGRGAACAPSARG